MIYLKVSSLKMIFYAVRKVPAAAAAFWSWNVVRKQKPFQKNGIDAGHLDVSSVLPEPSSPITAIPGSVILFEICCGCQRFILFAKCAVLSQLYENKDTDIMYQSSQAPDTLPEGI
jgi:hypothetical protein